MQVRFKPKYKIVMFGLKGVGKTSIVNQIALALPGNTITEENYSEKTFSQDGLFPADITLVDQPTYEDPYYHMLVPRIFKNADAGLLIFSLTDSDSFQKIPDALIKLKSHLKNGPIMLVGNKADLVQGQKINSSDAQTFADANNLIYKEVSARNKNEIAGIFQAIAEEILCANLIKDINLLMKNVGPSRVAMREALLAECKASKSLQHNIAAIERCGVAAQEDHETRSGLRWFWMFGPLVKETSDTKKICTDLIEKYSSHEEYKKLSLSN